MFAAMHLVPGFWYIKWQINVVLLKDILNFLRQLFLTFSFISVCFIWRLSYLLIQWSFYEHLTTPGSTKLSTCIMVFVLWTTNSTSYLMDLMLGLINTWPLILDGAYGEAIALLGSMLIGTEVLLGLRYLPNLPLYLLFCPKFLVFKLL